MAHCFGDTVGAVIRFDHVCRASVGWLGRLYSRAGANCTVCHDAVGYTGETFSQNWLDRSAFDFFDRLRTTMPNDNPGRLARNEYVDVLAYIFSLNGYPAGGEEMGTDDDVLRRVRIDLKPPGRKLVADTTNRVR
jgi:hypothetical protein